MLSTPAFSWLVRGFEHTVLNIARTEDEPTLILQMFVDISLLFTLLTVPFIELLRRELLKRKIKISLGRRPE